MKTNKLINSEYLNAKETARKELPMILEKIPKGNEKLYGFTSRDEFQISEVGDPFSYYSYNGSEMIKSSTITIPIIVEDEFRALASLDYIKDSLHIVDFGANELAKEIQLVQKQNTNFSFIGLLRIYRISSDFVIMSNNHENLIFPLNSAKIYLQSLELSEIKSYYTQNQIIDILNFMQNE